MECAFEIMSSEKKIGKISKISGKVSLEWEISNFFSYTEDNSKYVSPDFHALNLTWRFAVYPNGRNVDKSTGHVSLYLNRIDNGALKFVDFSFGIKTRKQLIVNKLETAWKTNNLGWGFSRFIQKSKLQQEKENLVPSGTLTVIFSLILKDDGQEFDMNESKSKIS